MRKLIDRLSEFSTLMLFSGIFSAVILLIMLIVSITSGYYGWLIGAAIGSVTELINIVLLYKGSDAIVSAKKPMLFIVFYMLRMALYAIAFIVCVIFGFRNDFFNTPFVPAFEYSIWGCLIAISPLQIIVIIVYYVAKKGIDNPVDTESKDA